MTTDNSNITKSQWRFDGLFLNGTTLMLQFRRDVTVALSGDQGVYVTSETCARGINQLEGHIDADRRADFLALRDSLLTVGNRLIEFALPRVPAP